MGRGGCCVSDRRMDGCYVWGWEGVVEVVV